MESSHDEVDDCPSRRGWDRMDAGVEQSQSESTDQTKVKVRMNEIFGCKWGHSLRRGLRRLKRALLLGVENPDKRTMVAMRPIGHRTDFAYLLWTSLTAQYFNGQRQEDGVDSMDRSEG